MFATILSTLLLTAPINPSLDIIREHHLETTEGRVSFLTEKLTAYVSAGEKLNEEITSLSEKAQTLNCETDQEEIVSLTATVAEKMDLMTWMLPSLQLALEVNEDLQQVDALLSTEESLTQPQQEIADRLALLCQYVDQYEQRSFPAESESALLVE